MGRRGPRARGAEPLSSALPPAALLDTSVLLRLFHPHDDPEQHAADAIGEALGDGRFEGVILDLSVYELLNVLVRRLRRTAREADEDMQAFFDLGLPMLGVDAELARAAASVAAGTGLSGYDAAFVAAARVTGLPLITADREILRRASTPHVRPLTDLGR